MKGKKIIDQFTDIKDANKRWALRNPEKVKLAMTQWNKTKYKAYRLKNKTKINLQRKKNYILKQLGISKFDLSLWMGKQENKNCKTCGVLTCRKWCMDCTEKKMEYNYEKRTV
jgi:hypothetical protein